VAEDRTGTAGGTRRLGSPATTTQRAVPRCDVINTIPSDDNGSAVSRRHWQAVSVFEERWGVHRRDGRAVRCLGFSGTIVMTATA